MAKKTNDKTIDLLYVNNKKQKKQNRNKNLPKKAQPQNDIINLDDEIIIGLTPKPQVGRSKPTHKKEKR